MQQRLYPPNPPWVMPLRVTVVNEWFASKCMRWHNTEKSRGLCANVKREPLSLCTCEYIQLMIVSNDLIEI